MIIFGLVSIVCRKPYCLVVGVTPVDDFSYTVVRFALISVLKLLKVSFLSPVLTPTIHLFMFLFGIGIMSFLVSVVSRLIQFYYLFEWG